HGSDGKDYYFRYSNLINKEDILRICENIPVSFNQKAMPKGYTAIDVSIDENIMIGYIIPDSIYVSKDPVIKGWETIELSNWVVYGTSRDSPDAAKNDMMSSAKAIGANAIINVEYFKTTGSESGTGNGTHYYTIHNFRGRAVNIGKKSPNGKYSQDELIKIDKTAGPLKAKLQAQTKLQQTNAKNNIILHIMIMLGLIALTANFNVFMPFLVVGIAILAIMIFYNFSDLNKSYDSWLQPVNNTKYSDIGHKCTNCGKRNEQNSNFCIYCGSKVESKRSNYANQETLADCAVTLIAYVAKADGRISPNEANIISKLLSHISDNDVTLRSSLKEIYNHAKNNHNKDHQHVAQKMHMIIQKELSAIDQKHFPKTFVRWLVQLVYADNVKNLIQASVAEQIGHHLGVSKDYIIGLYAEFDNMRKEEKSKAYQSSNTKLNECYLILKCSPNSSNEEIKKSYRELVKQYHPDTIQGKGLSEDFILFANQKFKEINNAYEAIKKHRGMR
ncbi:MAG: DnaJ domain-containing protein, partial [Campylobacterales bacterium]|nr:DnaJ domain-containing protein [Campylobacterales bacterium]